MGPFGLSFSLISGLLEQSKYLALNSSAEGNATVVKEAVISGCTVIGRDDLQGGTFEVVPQNKLYITDNIYDWVKTHRFDSKDGHLKRLRSPKFRELLNHLGIREADLENYDELFQLDRLLPANQMQESLLRMFEGKKWDVTFDLFEVKDWLRLTKVGMKGNIENE